MKTFHEEYGYLIKNLATGDIDTNSQYPKCKAYTLKTPLVEGFVWVKVKLSYTEVES